MLLTRIRGRGGYGTSALIGGTAILLAAGTLQGTRAQELSIGQTVTQAQAERQIAFDIPAQPLSQALTLFGRQAGLQVAVNAAGVAGKATNGVVGTMTAEAALRQLLAGTGVTYRFTSPSSVTVAPPADVGGAMQLDPVQVHANVPPSTATIGNLPPAAPGGQVATGGTVGILGSRTYQDLPYSVTGFTSTLIEDQQARTIGNVVANDPSATKVAPQAIDTLRIRGFLILFNAISIDGLFGLASQNRTVLSGYERVEVFKGPSAFLNGFVGNAVGGNVNLVPKRATKDPITTVMLNYGTVGQVGVQADVGRRFGPEGQFGIRANGLFRDGYISLQNARERSGDAQLALDYLGDGVRAAVNFGYTKHDLQAFNQIFTLAPAASVPVAPNASRAVQQPWETVNTEAVYGMGRAEIDLGRHFTAYAAYGQSYYRELQLRTLARNLNSFGSYSTFAQQTSETYWNQAGEIGIRGNFDTGFVNHRVAMVTNGNWLIRGDQSSSIPSFNLTNNLYNPLFQIAPAYTPNTANPAKASATTQLSFALTDTLSAWNERVQVILGGRNQSIVNTNYSPTGAPTNNYYATVFSPTLGMVLKPWSNISVYGNYIQGLQPGPIAPNFAVNAGEAFAPLVSKQFEVGAKIDLGSWSTTLGLFDITQPSGIFNSSTGIFSVDGMQRHQGIELNVFGEPLPGFRVLGGLLLLDARYASTADGAFDGNRVPGTSDFTLKLGAEYDVPFAKGLTLSGRVNYFSSQFANDLNTQALSPYTIVNIGARYAFEVDKRPMVIRANIDNLLNESAWASAGSGGTIYRGTPLTFLLTLAANF